MQSGTCDSIQFTEQPWSSSRRSMTLRLWHPHPTGQHDGPLIPLVSRRASSTAPQSPYRAHPASCSTPSRSTPWCAEPHTLRSWHDHRPDNSTFSARSNRLRPASPANTACCRTRRRRARALCPSGRSRCGHPPYAQPVEFALGQDAPASDAGALGAAASHLAGMGPYHTSEQEVRHATSAWLAHSRTLVASPILFVLFPGATRLGLRFLRYHAAQALVVLEDALALLLVAGPAPFLLSPSSSSSNAGGRHPLCRRLFGLGRCRLLYRGASSAAAASSTSSASHSLQRVSTSTSASASAWRQALPRRGGLRLLDGLGRLPLDHRQGC